ncbi:hypothetical protein PUN28_006609 [Cardiocondyla obscurior]|uniref:Uncharacterized protein n=1 Tax=Cardiocondyla obscurior TaxID=286306 RepID=A0AAW2GBE2_9HYME
MRGKVRRDKSQTFPVDVLAIVLRHRLRAGLGREYAVVAVVLELRQEEVVELVRLDLLQADDVRGVVPYFVEDTFLPVFPVQRPARAVTVHLPRRVFVAQHVVAHHREYTCEQSNTFAYTWNTGHTLRREYVIIKSPRRRAPGDVRPRRLSNEKLNARRAFSCASEMSSRFCRFEQRKRSHFPRALSRLPILLVPRARKRDTCCTLRLSRAHASARVDSHGSG